MECACGDGRGCRGFCELSRQTGRALAKGYRERHWSGVNDVFILLFDRATKEMLSVDEMAESLNGVVLLVGWMF